MKTAISIEYIIIDDAVPYARNARTHSPKQVERLKNSIQRFGFIHPIIVDQQGTIVAGHGRLRAAKALGLERIPTLRVERLSEDALRAYRLADNRLAELADRDESLLRIELEYLSQVDVDVDVDLTGFSTPDIDILLGAADDHRYKEPSPQAPPSPQDTVTRPGDVYELGAHRIICGDCRDPLVVDQLMDGRCAQMVITDPPYNVPVAGHVSGLGKHQHEDFQLASGEMTPDAFTGFLSTALSGLVRVSVDGALHYIFMDWRHISELMSACQPLYKDLLNLCVWSKANGGMGSLYRSQHELVFVYKAGAAPHINNVKSRIHSAQSYEACLQDAVTCFDSFARQISKQLAARIPMTPRRRRDWKRRLFHSLKPAAEALLANFDISIFRKMKPEDVRFTIRMFHRRHVYEHSGGEVDEKYIRDSGDSTVRPKQTIRKTSESAQRIVCPCQNASGESSPWIS